MVHTIAQLHVPIKYRLMLLLLLWHPPPFSPVAFESGLLLSFLFVFWFRILINWEHLIHANISSKAGLPYNIITADDLVPLCLLVNLQDVPIQDPNKGLLLWELACAGSRVVVGGDDRPSCEWRFHRGVFLIDNLHITNCICLTHVT
jgi:hypothetical protein